MLKILHGTKFYYPLTSWTDVNYLLLIDSQMETKLDFRQLL